MLCPFEFYQCWQHIHFNMKLSSLTLLSILGVVAALPVNTQDCTSNGWEKFHELHFHDINTGVLLGYPLGFKLEGGTGCYKGEKTVFAPEKDKKPKSADHQAQQIPQWMKELPGYQDAVKGINLPPQSSPYIPIPLYVPPYIQGPYSNPNQPPAWTLPSTWPQNSDPNYPQAPAPQHAGSPVPSYPQYPSASYSEVATPYSSSPNFPTFPQFPPSSSPAPPSDVQRPPSSIKPPTGSPTESSLRPARTYIDPKNPNVVIVEVYAPPAGMV
jgi:hypothetical protein